MLFGVTVVVLVEVEITDGADPIVMLFVQQCFADVPPAIRALGILTLLRGQSLKRFPQSRIGTTGETIQQDR